MKKRFSADKWTSPALHENTLPLFTFHPDPALGSSSKGIKNKQSSLLDGKPQESNTSNPAIWSTIIIG